MKNIFTKHPNSVGESYIKHFYNALSFSCLLFLLSFKAFIHAILPFMFETSVSDRVKTLNNDMQKRKEEAINKN